jgi:hypothetical protein
MARSTVTTRDAQMSLKDRISAFENDAKILERIASQYDETSPSMLLSSTHRSLSGTC